MGCESVRPEPGQIEVATVGCLARVPRGGHGTTSGVYLANHWFRVIIRAPLDALTWRGVAGATVVDAAAWEHADVVHEVVPLVEGSWLSVASVALEVDGATVTGIAAGRARSVRYRIDPDAPWLQVEGADGLHVHLSGDVQWWGGGALVARDTLVAVSPRPSSIRDLGGAVQFDGSTRLLVADAAEGWSTWAEDGTAVSGTASNADELVWFEGGVEAGRAPIRAGAFSLAVPATADGVRAEASGRAPSVTVAPGPGLELEVGGRGTVELALVGAERVSWVEASWWAADGRADSFLVPSEGGLLRLGAGTHLLELTAGPTVEPTTIEVTLADDEARTVDVVLREVFDPGAWVQMGFDGSADRSPRVRASNGALAERAAGAGHAWTLFAPVDVVPRVTRDPAVPGEPPIPDRLAFRGGTRLTGPGWSATAWPWADTPGRALFGGIQTLLDEPADAAGALRRGAGTDGALLVDLGWLGMVPGEPFVVAPRPDFVRLTAPDPELVAWARWFAWLDAGRALVPVGPVTWVPVPDPERASVADVEQPLFRGRVAAGSGPLLTLAIDGLPSGAVVPYGGTHRVEVDLRGADWPIQLWGTAGLRRRADAPQVADVAFDAGWVIAFAQDPADPARWVVTGPVWLAP